MTNIFGANGVSGGVSGAGFGAFAPEAPADPNQPAWMTSFQDTLQEIHEKGFQAYAKDLNEQKLEELRKKILEKMGLSEEDLGKMSSEQRNMIEKMIAAEIRDRLAAETEMKAKGKDGAENGIAAAGQAQGTNPADQAAKTMAEANAPNGFGAGMTLIRAMEARAEAEPQQDV